MCGIAGLAAADGRGALPRSMQSDVALMLSAIAHRGPDGERVEVLDGAALGHRRLAIIDLTDRASQPMPLRCADGPEPTAWVALNGEIYNYVELRSELAARGHRFRSDSDTETILHLYEEDGPACVRRLRGMFAFALWDAPLKRLLLARDRLGKKPLYYTETGDGLAFASELKALVALARSHGRDAAVDPVALRSYLALKYVPGPGTAVRGIRKLPAAHVLTYEAGRTGVESYWRLPAAQPDERPSDAPGGAGGDDRWNEQLVRTIDDAVRIRMRSDVPIGLLLSGGLDSGIVASRMAAAAGAGGRIETFSVGFDEADYDELGRAGALARALGTRHHEIRIRPTPAQVAHELPALAWHLDQPFADSSALAMYHLAREVSRHVKVALSGDGADELFLGYDRYRAHRLAGRIGGAPGRGVDSSALAARLLAALSRLGVVPTPGRRNLAGRALRFLQAVSLPAEARNDAWVRCLDEERTRAVLSADFLQAAGDADPLEALRRGAEQPDAPRDPLLTIQRADLLVWLPDDVLHKVDATTMAHALEARAPLLDHLVVELAMRIPASLKLPVSGRGEGKRILRRAFARDLPRGVAKARKAGFGLPLDHWLRKDLSGWCRDLLFDRRTLDRGILRRDGVERLLFEHVEGRANHEEAIWALVMLEHWLRGHDAATAQSFNLVEAAAR